MLRFSAMGRFPNFATDRRLSRQPGWITIITGLAGVSAQLRSMGILNQSQPRTHNQSAGSGLGGVQVEASTDGCCSVFFCCCRCCADNVWLALNKASGTTLQDDLSVSRPNVFHLEYDDEAAPPTHQLKVYKPRPVHPRLNPDGLYPPKMNFYTDVRLSDSPSLIRQYLGPPINVTAVPINGSSVSPTTMHQQYVELGQALRARSLTVSRHAPAHVHADADAHTDTDADTDAAAHARSLTPTHVFRLSACADRVG